METTLIFNTLQIASPQWCFEMITVTTVVEHVFCPKFTYYGQVMGLEQYEEKRGTVISGREHHSKSEKTNRNFIPQNLQGEKITSLKMYSKKHGYVGIVDHCVVTSNEVVLFERKYTSQVKVHDSLRVQLGLLSILLEENLAKPVHRAFVIFTKDDTRTQIEVEIDAGMKEFAIDSLNDVKKVIKESLLPVSHYDNRCVNCCYNKICDVGSLNSPR